MIAGVKRRVHFFGLDLPHGDSSNGLVVRQFGEMIVEKIRADIFTYKSITELVETMDEKMDSIASVQRGMQRSRPSPPGCRRGTVLR